jgi:hypothetical protein
MTRATRRCASAGIAEHTTSRSMVAISFVGKSPWQLIDAAREQQHVRICDWIKLATQILTPGRLQL